jgi:hypothetical protein
MRIIRGKRFDSVSNTESTWASDDGDGGGGGYYRQHPSDGGGVRRPRKR